jgi:hypothetical protein
MKKIITASLIYFCAQYSSAQHADTPPMGWNSYDSFGATVTESEMKGNTDIMATHLKHLGWEYVVVDYCWSYPDVAALNNPPQTEDYQPRLAMDKFGRLMPDEERFPSAQRGKGFKPLADYVHSKGLKFGIHVMRGIPRQAVADDTPILGSSFSAADIADQTDTCQWLDNMYGLNFANDGSQEYYNSLFRLYASWDVDFVKVDDILAIGPYHDKDIEAIRKAIDECGRPMVLSLSPGDAPIEKAEHLKKYANMWRISGDFWDDWETLKRMFELAAEWHPHIGKGHWPDADMIPIGKLSIRGPHGPERRSNFTENEQRTLWALWAIARSPLMYGGDLMQMRTFEHAMLTNKAMIEVNQRSSNNRPLFQHGNHIAWVADAANGEDKYLAVFNLGDDTTTPVYVPLDKIGLNGTVEVKDIFAHKSLGVVEKAFMPKLGKHEGRLYRIIPN